MLEFRAQTTITLIVPHEYDTTALTVTAFDYEVRDAAGTVLKARAANPDFTLGTDTSSLVIDDSYNTTTAKTDVRQVNCFLTTAEGEYDVVIIYKIKNNPLQLTVPTDSFLTYAEAVLIRTKISDDLEFYDDLTDELKVVALENAFLRLSTLKFVLSNALVTNLGSYTAENFNALDANFLIALKKAQIVEANLIVENSPVADKIRQGIISETIGESSMFFKQSTPIASKYPGISDEAYMYLRKYLYRNVTNNQIWRISRA